MRDDDETVQCKGPHGVKLDPSERGQVTWRGSRAFQPHMCRPDRKAFEGGYNVGEGGTERRHGPLREAPYGPREAEGELREGCTYGSDKVRGLRSATYCQFSQSGEFTNCDSKPGIVEVFQRPSISGGEQVQRYEGSCVPQNGEEGRYGALSALWIGMSLVVRNVDLEGREVRESDSYGIGEDEVMELEDGVDLFQNNGTVPEHVSNREGA